LAISFCYYRTPVNPLKKKLSEAEGEYTRKAQEGDYLSRKVKWESFTESSRGNFGRGKETQQQKVIQSSITFKESTLSQCLGEKKKKKHKRKNKGGCAGRRGERIPRLIGTRGSSKSQPKNRLSMREEANESRTSGIGGGEQEKNGGRGPLSSQRETELGVLQSIRAGGGRSTGKSRIGKPLYMTDNIKQFLQLEN